YTWTAPCSGPVSVWTCCDNAFDTVVAVYTGPCSSLTLIGCNDDAGPNGPCPNTLQSFVSFTATSGTVYHIRVGGFAGACGCGCLTIMGPPNPAVCPPGGPPTKQRLFRVTGPGNGTNWAWCL